MRLHSAFQQRKGSGLVFFFRFGAIAAYSPKTRKKRVRIHFMKTWYGRFTRQKYLAVPTFLWVRTHFFLWCKWGFSLQTSLISVVAQDLPVSLKLKNVNFFGKRWIFVRTERQFEEIPLLENLLISPNPSLKINVNHSVESENN